MLGMSKCIVLCSVFDEQFLSHPHVPEDPAEECGDAGPGSDRDGRDSLLIDADKGADEDGHGGDMLHYHSRVCYQGPKVIWSESRINLEI